MLRGRSWRLWLLLRDSKETHSNKHWLRRRWERWLSRRIPPAGEITLSHRNVFIFPSRTGWAFGILLIALLLTAINYQNSLIYGLTFWLLSIGHGTIWLTFRNLSGNTLIAGRPDDCFAGDRVELPVTMKANKNWAVAIVLGYPNEGEHYVTLAPGESQRVDLGRLAQRRGKLTDARLKVETQYPFGLLRAWSWAALDFDVTVYPKPEYTPLQFSEGTDGEHSGDAVVQILGDDIAGIREYGYGDGLNQISWKHSARTGALKTREREQEQGVMCWLSWDALPPEDSELRLSRLTSWVLQADEKGWRYGLKLPGVEIAPDQGPSHRAQCLKALALW